MPSEEAWTAYVRGAGGGSARPLLAETVTQFSPEPRVRSTLDLGCGAGGDTLERARA